MQHSIYSCMFINNDMMIEILYLVFHGTSRNVNVGNPAIALV